MKENLTSSSESSAPVDPLQLALKKVYSIHKEKVKELSEEKDDFKEGCELLLQHKTRLLEKVQSLQNHNEVLYNENTRLRNHLDTLRSQEGRGSGNCVTCDHLQRSLSAIQEAYKHSLDEKEKMIHYLEERVAELSRQSSPFSKQPELNLSSLLTPDKSINEGETSRPGSSQGKSPALYRRGEEGRDKQSTATASKKILEAVTNRLGRESTQDQDVLHDEGRRLKKTSSESKMRKDNYADQGNRLRRLDDTDAVSFDGLADNRNGLGSSINRNSRRQEHTRRSQTVTSSTGEANERRNDIMGKNQKRLEGVRHEAKSLDVRQSRDPARETVGMGQPSTEDEEKESPETIRLRKLGLGRNRGKRSRYTEDSPTNKKRQKCDKSDLHTTSEESDEAVPRHLASHSHQQQRSQVFVQETCDPESDRAISMSSDTTPEKVPRSRRSSVVDTNQPELGVVPETLGMGLTSSESESDDDMDTQSTIKARSQDGSPRDVQSSHSDLLNSPLSDTESHAKLGKDKVLGKRRNLLEHNQFKEKAASEIYDLKDNPGNKKEAETLSDSARSTGSKQDKNTDLTSDHSFMTRPSSPVFSGGRGPRRSVESPFLFDEDGPGSSKSLRRMSANLSGLVSDQESPLLLRPIDAVVQRTNCGQSPLLKETNRSKKGEETGKQTLRKSHTDTECFTKSSQDGLQRLVKGKSLRNSEKLKQTTLSQAFTPSPPFNLSPTKPAERAAIDKAIRLSLQEIDGNKDFVKGKKPLFGKQKEKVVEAAAAENVPPLFKKPPSPNTLKSPSKRKSPNKRSPPKQRLHKSSLSQCKPKQSTKEDVIDLDETVPPDSLSLESRSKPDQASQKNTPGKAQSVFSVNVLNESLDPDVSLTQYCSDTELLSQRHGHRTRSSRGLRSASQSLDKPTSMDIGTSNGRKRQVGKGSTYHTTHTNELPVPKIGSRKSGVCRENNNQSERRLASLDEDIDIEISTLTSNKSKSKSNRHFAPSEHGSLDDCVSVASSGVSKPSSSVEILRQGQGPSLDMEENEADVTLDPRFMRAHLYEGQMEESQSIPLSSCSYKFGTSKSSKSGSSGEVNLKKQEDDVCDLEDEEENTMTPEGTDCRRKSFNDSFDRVPQKNPENYAHVDVVRKKAERQQLKATTCQECYDYYKSKGCSEEEIQQQIQNCSRHRARYLPPSTPEHFWSIGFPDTQECEERGYIGVESPSKKKPAYRRRRKLAKHFKSRQEEHEEEEEESQPDTQT